jgi:hypothetical protein
MGIFFENFTDYEVLEAYLKKKNIDFFTLVGLLLVKKHRKFSGDKIQE